MIKLKIGVKLVLTTSFLGMGLFNGGLKAQEGEKITLEQAIALTLKNNLQIKQSKLSEALTEENIKEAKLQIYPTLNANTGLNFNFGRNPDPTTYQFVNQRITTANGSVSAGLPIFQGFRLWNQISQNKAQLEADKSNTRKIENDLSLSVVTTYLDVLNNTDLLSAAKQQLAVANQQLSFQQKQFDVGTKTLADLSQAKAQAATAELNVTNAQNQLNISYLNLAQLMERDPAVAFIVERPVVNQIDGIHRESAPSIFNKAASNYPDINLARNRTITAEKAVDVARSALYPRLSLNANLGSGYSSNRFKSTGAVATGGNTVIGVVEGTNQNVVTPEFTSLSNRVPFSDQISENFNQSVGLSLSIPIFNGLSSRIAVRRAKINYQNAVVSEQLAKNNFNKVIYQAVTDLRAAEGRFQSATSAFESSKDAFQVIEKRYGVGLANALEFTQAQTDMNQKEFDLIQAKYNLLFRNKIIDFYIGNPLTF